MYRDSYRDDYDRDLDSRPIGGYARDPYYEERSRERKYDLDDRERPSLRYAPPPPPIPSDDPYYSRLEELESRMMTRTRNPPVARVKEEPLGCVHLGSVFLYPRSPFERPPKSPHDKPPNCDTVFVGSLCESMTDRNLHDLFESCGKITDVRVSRGRGFGHVQFSDREAVDTAILLNGCVIRVNSERSKSDTCRIHVDFAAARGEPEFQRRVQNEETLNYGVGNAQTITSDLHRDESFQYGVKNIMQWIEKGCCNSSTASSFFDLISHVNSHCRKLSKDSKSRQEEVVQAMSKKVEFLERLQSDCRMATTLYDMAMTQKAWDHFTKPQRKTATGWKDFASELMVQSQKRDDGSPAAAAAAAAATEDEGLPKAKKARKESSTDTELQADLERAEKEIEQLRTDHEIALERKDKQIHQLKALLAAFRKTCPEEWEKALGVSGKGDTKSKVKEEANGVDLDDLTAAMDTEEGSSSLAQAAAAYAQMRSTVTKTDTEASENGMTETEIAMATVLAAFLTVHPLGASLDEVVQYFQVFNPNANGIYLESLLRRLPQVFQLSQSTTGESKWWFLGFQTCCTQSQLGSMATEDGAESAKASSS